MQNNPPLWPNRCGWFDLASIKLRDNAAHAHNDCSLTGPHHSAL